MLLSLCARALPEENAAGERVVALARRGSGSADARRAAGCMDRHAADRGDAVAGVVALAVGLGRSALHARPAALQRAVAPSASPRFPALHRDCEAADVPRLQ